MTDDDRALFRAREHCFLSGVGDVGETLCALNMPYGIAKIQHVQRELGLPQDASFVGAPDATVTRNKNRWQQGFGYGGRVQWTGDFAVLDIKSNHCGMIAAFVEDPPSPQGIEERARALIEKPLVIDGVEIDFDLGESNHFLDLCDVTESDTPVPKTLAVIHSSGHEFRKHSPRGPGIYWDESDSLAKLMETRETPWGPLHILRGQDAASWLDAYLWCQDFSLRRREALARALLGPIEVVCNRTHQGLAAINDAILGCYAFDETDLQSGQLFPLTLGPDLPLYLVQPSPSFSDAALEATGFGERARRLGLEQRLREVNLLPHGGGYSYAQLADARVSHDAEGRLFELVHRDGHVESVRDVRASAFGYRGDEVRARMIELGLGTPVLTSSIRYILRT
ncbi:MAG: hypothetical protein R3B13_35615 [Polyangiaceae bacterium]